MKTGTAACLLATVLLATSAAAAEAPTLDVAAADNAFGFRLLAMVQRESPEANVVLSPVSAALDLALVLNAAADRTKREMLSALSLDGFELDAVNAANAALIKSARNPAGGVTLSIANSLWANSRKVELRADYVDRMQGSYEAQIAGVDFDRPGTVTLINDWASKATAGKIPKVLDRLDAGDLVVLLNAVYFKGKWARPFDPGHTQMRDFAMARGGVKPVARMVQTGRYDYVETPLLQAVRLPFGDSDLVMDVMLPAKATTLSAMVASLQSDDWAALARRFSRQSGTIELPRFELNAHHRLNEALKRLGMSRIFQPIESQLPGLFNTPAGHSTSGFYISSVQQSAYWKVDEEGAEAAAVTSIAVTTAAIARPPPPFHMIVDRPFFCAIEDRRSGALLFVAAIVDPAS